MKKALERCVRLFLKWLQCLYETLCAGPVLLLLGVLLVPGPFLWICAAYLAGACLLGLLLGLPLKRSRMWLRLLLTLAVAIVPACYLFPPENWAPVAGVFGFVAVFRGSTLTHTTWEEHYPLPVSWIGLGLYLVLSYLFTQGGLLIPYLPVFTVMGAVFIVSTVFALNHRAMAQAAPSQGGSVSLPRRMMKQNRWLIALLIFVVLGAGLFREIKDAVAAGALAVAQWIGGILEALYGGMQQVPLEEGGGMLMPPQTGTANPFWEMVLTILLYIVAGAVGLFLVAGLAVIVYRGLRRVFRALLNLLGSRSHPMSQGYIDQRESLWDMGRIARHTLSRTRRWLRKRFAPRERWADMTDNRKRARFLYRRYIRRAMAAGYTPDPAATAAETLAAARPYAGNQPGPPAGLYEMARYGDAQPSDGDIAAAKAILDR